MTFIFHKNRFSLYRFDRKFPVFFSESGNPADSGSEVSNRTGVCAKPSGFCRGALGAVFCLAVFCSVWRVSARELKFVGSVSLLSQESADKVWKEVQTVIEEMNGSCSVKKDGKAPPQTNQWIAQARKLRDTAGSLYEKHKYSFNGIKITDGGRQTRLDTALSNIEAVLKSHHIAPFLKGGKAACQDLKSGFAFAYGSYINIQDTEDPVKAMPPWAGRVYASIACLCP